MANKLHVNAWLIMPAPSIPAIYFHSERQRFNSLLYLHFAIDRSAQMQRGYAPAPTLCIPKNLSS